MLWLYVSCAFVSEDEFTKRQDPDGDGIAIEEDCNNTNADPSKSEKVTLYEDVDGDGYGDPNAEVAYCPEAVPESGWVIDNTDCNDGDPGIHANALELCDDKDNDCNELVDDIITDPEAEIGGTMYYMDSDGDGYGDAQQVVQSCSLPEGYAEIFGDCDDGLDRTYPDAPELCDNLDNDCDGEIDNGAKIPMYPDMDGDGYTETLEAVELCPSYLQEGYTEEKKSLVDCDDQNAEIYPGREESCDNIDNNCNNLVDEGLLANIFLDQDGDGYGYGSAVQECINPDGSAPAGYALSPGDCDDSDFLVYPDQQEYCDGVDNDCDGAIDEGVKITYFTDADGDGYGNPQSPFQSCPNSSYVIQSGDCNDNNPFVHPTAPEICDGVDNDCNGSIPSVEQDPDGDHYIACSLNTSTTQYASFVVGGGDCENTNSQIHPGAIEIPLDGIDQNCDSLEACPFDSDGDGFESLVYPVLDTDLSCAFTTEQDCDDNDSDIYPGAPEYANATDYNCDRMERDDDTCFSVEVGSVYFLMCSGNVDWYTAYDYCHTAGYDFASIENSTENAALAANVGNKGAWIGYQDVLNASSFCGLTDMNFQWVDGQNGYYSQFYNPNCVSSVNSSGYFNWGADEPNNLNGAEGCTLLQSDTYWSDFGCTAQRQYICESRP